MEHRKLGLTGLSIPIIGMGTWKTFDVRGRKEMENCAGVVDTAFRNGSLFYDSSPMYGEAEKVLGWSVEELKIRQQAIIATKVWTGSDAESEKQFKDAFNYFGGWVDLYQVHNLVAWQKRLKQLHEFRMEGKVKAVGVTHYMHSSFPELLDIMHTQKIDSIQVPYNVLDREIEKEILPLAEKLNLGVIIMHPFGEGKLIRNTPSDAELEPFKSFEVKTWPEILLKWILSDKRITCAIPATSHPAHMASNCLAGAGPWFDKDTREEIARLVQRY